MTPRHSHYRARPCNYRGRFSVPLGGTFGGPANEGEVLFNAILGIVGDSNAVGAANFGATGQQDTGYGVVDVNGVGYAPAQIDAQWSQSIVSPIVWLTMTGNLRAYDIAGTLNMGSEQTLGRRLVEMGIHASPKINKFAISGSTQHTHYRTDSTFPLNGGLNLHQQMVAYLLAREATLGHPHDAIVVVLGENDCASSTNANATQTDLGNIIGGLRTGLGRPNQLVYLVVINAATTGAFASTVISQQIAYVASDSFCRAIRVDDIPLASNPHYGANGYYTIGDRIARQLNKDFYADRPRNRGVGPAPWFNDYGSFVSLASGANGSPRAGSQEMDGDWQFLILTGQATTPSPSLVTAAGFTLVGSGDSIFGGTNHRSMSIWERRVTAASFDANTGLMPTPTVTNGTVATSGAGIITVRGPNPWSTSPLAGFQIGANNANATTLTLPGITTTANNTLAVFVSSVPSNTSLVTSVTNSNVAGITIQRQSVFNQASFIGAMVATGTIATSGTVVGNTTVTASGAGNSVGFSLFINP